MTAGDLKTKTDLSHLYPRREPLAVEIGFGDGRFLVHLARVYPNWNILGVEIASASVARAYRRLRREGINSVRVHQGNGAYVIREVFAPQSLHRIYVNFPDPWPRKRNTKRRLLQAGFFVDAVGRLSPGGAIELTTDHAEYYAFAIAEAEASGVVTVEEGQPPIGTLSTKYAMKWLAEDRPIYHVKFVPRHHDATPYLIHSSATMQHARMTGDLSAVELTFPKITQRTEKAVVIIEEAFRSSDGQRLLFFAGVEEPQLRQDVVVEVEARAEDILVGIKSFTSPLSTTGTAQAVDTVIDYLSTFGLQLIDKRY